MYLLLPINKVNYIKGFILGMLMFLLIFFLIYLDTKFGWLNP